MHPSSSKAFQRHQEHNLKHPGLVDLTTTKQNKLPYFIDGYIQMELISSVTVTCPTMCWMGQLIVRLFIGGNFTLGAN
jgi:hypothetical protein